MSPLHRCIGSCLLAACFGVIGSSVWAHGGEEHSHDAAPVAAAPTQQAPRASARSEEFELVAVLENSQLTLYLDRYADNAPVADAQIELESGAIKRVAKQLEPGVYALPAEAFAKPGKYPLVFTIQTADSADLLATTLEVAEVAQPVAGIAQPARSDVPRFVWIAAGALLLAGVGVVWMRRRK